MRPPLLVLLALVLHVTVRGVSAQSDGVLRIDDPLHRFLFQQQTAGHLPDAHLGSLPLSAYEAHRYLDSLDRRREQLNLYDRAYLDRFLGNRGGPGAEAVQRRLPFLYRNGRDFISVDGESFGLQVNPLLYLAYGRGSTTRRDQGPAMPSSWQNTRGIEVSGHLGQHVFFETRLEETQRRDLWPAFDPKFTAPRLAVIRFNAGRQEYDYQVATGLVGIKTNHFEIRAGRDRSLWGFGRGSLALSDYAPAYDQLQIRTSFWRVHYTNLFTVLGDLSDVPPAVPNYLIPHKFGAFHRLSLQLPKRVQLEIFEGVIVLPDTAANPDRFRLDVTYLNPVIFYRAVEADRGSADNVLLGGGLSWVFLPGFRIYAQLLLDELNVGQIGKGWWGNKWGWMAGLHVVDVPFPNASVRVEYARLRPYLYSHSTAHNAYVHHDDLLGHPAGPNAEDVALFLTFQPTLRTHAALMAAYTRRGRNTDELNFGADPRLPYTSRVAEQDVWLLQGIRQNRWLIEAYAGVELLPDLYLDAALRSESVRDAVDGHSHYLLPYLVLRWGMPYQSVRY